MESAPMETSANSSLCQQKWEELALRQDVRVNPRRRPYGDARERVRLTAKWGLFLLEQSPLCVLYVMPRRVSLFRRMRPL